jgi:hypothetical protein
MLLYRTAPPSSLCTDALMGEGQKRVGEKHNHSTARKPGPLLIIQYSLAWNPWALAYHLKHRNRFSIQNLEIREMSRPWKNVSN